MSSVEGRICGVQADGTSLQGGMGCRRQFLHLADDLCSKCQYVAKNPNLSPEDLALLKRATQCSSCSVYSAMIEDPCQLCRRMYFGEEDPAQAQRAQQRAEQMAKTTNAAQGAGGSRHPLALLPASTMANPPAPAVGATTPQHTLSNARESLQSGGPLYDVSYSATWSSSKSAIGELGRGSVQINGRASMQNLFQMIRDELNPRFRRECQSPIDLDSAFFTFRFPSGFNLDHDTDTYTVSGFCNYYLKRYPSTLDRYFPPRKKTVHGRGEIHALDLQLVINKPKYQQAIAGASTARGLASVSTKGRKRVQSTTASREEGVKKPRTSSGALKTRIIEAVSPLPAPGAHGQQSAEIPVTFFQYTPSIDRTTGLVTFTQSLSKVKGYITVVPLPIPYSMRGRTKVIYGFRLDGDDGNEYVAKALARASPGMNVKKEAEHLLFCDVACLKRLQDTAIQFQTLVETSVATTIAFDVADAFIISDCCPEPGSTSTAGVHGTYIIERKLPTYAVDKFYGTLRARDTTDIPYNVVNALWHFCVDLHESSFAFADLQGSWINRDGKSVLILFDPQCHSILSGDNVSCSLGWGDFGPRGLEDLLRSHQCSDICEELALRPKEEMLEDFFAKQKSVAEAEKKLQDAECAYGELTAVQKEGQRSPQLGDFVNGCYPADGIAYDIYTPPTGNKAD